MDYTSGSELQGVSISKFKKALKEGEFELFEILD